MRGLWRYVSGSVLLSCMLFSCGCASSGYSRGAESQFHDAVSSGDGAGGRLKDTSLDAAWQNSSQTAKGLLIGGAVGAAAGSAVSGIGSLAGAAAGALFGGAVGSLTDAHTTLADQLTNRDATVMVIGDQIRIVVPAERVFVDDTARLSPYAAGTLDVAVRYINQYPNRRVTVGVFSDRAGSERVARALTDEQAGTVARYLWSRGLNTRLLYAAGYGGMRPVVGDCEKGGRDNNRVEITLEKLPA